jgi:hypothetical protein
MAGACVNRGRSRRAGVRLGRVGANRPEARTSPMRKGAQCPPIWTCMTFAVSAEDVAKAHEADVATQGNCGVETTSSTGSTRPRARGSASPARPTTRPVRASTASPTASRRTRCTRSSPAADRTWTVGDGEAHRTSPPRPRNYRAPADADCARSTPIPPATARNSVVPFSSVQS